MKKVFLLIGAIFMGLMVLGFVLAAISDQPRQDLSPEQTKAKAQDMADAIKADNARLAEAKAAADTEAKAVAERRPFPADPSPEYVIARWGKPDIDDSTAFDKPRPPIVTRWLDYREKMVRFYFRADADIGAPPPYKWKIFVLQDTFHKGKLTTAEVLNRLGNGNCESYDCLDK